jgi:hypothetical protein
MEEARQRMEEKVGLDAASIAFKAGELLAQLLRDEVEKANPLALKTQGSRISEHFLTTSSILSLKWVAIRRI